MKILIITFFLLITSLISITTYVNYAERFGYRIGEIFLRNSVLNSLSGLLLIGAVATSFVFLDWKIAILIVVISWLMSGFLTKTFKSQSQIIFLITFIISFIALIIQLI